MMFANHDYLFILLTLTCLYLIIRIGKIRFQYIYIRTLRNVICRVTIF